MCKYGFVEGKDYSSILTNGFDSGRLYTEAGRGWRTKMSTVKAAPQLEQFCFS